jgi:hypothetical protein
MSPPTDLFLVWRSVRRDALGPYARSTLWVENISISFHAQREPQQSKRFGRASRDSFSRSKDGILLMRLPAAMGGTGATGLPSCNMRVVLI